MYNRTISKKINRFSKQIFLIDNKNKTNIKYFSSKYANIPVFDQPEKVADYMMKKYTKSKKDYIGENCTQFQHADQSYKNIQNWCKAYNNNNKFCRINNDFRKTIGLAAFAHDFGMLWPEDKEIQKMISSDGTNLGFKNHGELGQDFFNANGFHPIIGEMSRMHVVAKRALCSMNQEQINEINKKMIIKLPSPYIIYLSNASRKTLLEHQGGLMNESELKRYMKNPLALYSFVIRFCDDNSKYDKSTNSEDFYYKLIVDHLKKYRNSSDFLNGHF